MSDLVERLKSILACIEELSQTSQSTVRLIAVSKTKPVENILELYQAGQRYFGENYVDELEKKSNDPLILAQCPDIRWHFIGHLQSNKVNRILTRVPHLDCIQTIDSLELANRINNNLQQQSKTLKIFLQINTSAEEQKSGIERKDLPPLYEHVRANCTQLVCEGLMTIGSLTNVSSDDDADFRALVQCRAELCEKLQCPLKSIELSMGMSNDYERAIQAGSTVVRVGSSIFGSRSWCHRDLFSLFKRDHPDFFQFQIVHGVQRWRSIFSRSISRAEVRAGIVRSIHRLVLTRLFPDHSLLSLASKSIGSTDLMNMKRRMQLISSEAKTELKQNVYRNHTKFIETAKEVSSLESEVYQLHSLLADEKQLLNTVKELLNVENQVRLWSLLKSTIQSRIVTSRPIRRAPRTMTRGRLFCIIVKVWDWSRPTTIVAWSTVANCTRWKWRICRTKLRRKLPPPIRKHRPMWHIHAMVFSSRITSSLLNPRTFARPRRTMSIKCWNCTKPPMRSILPGVPISTSRWSPRPSRWRTTKMISSETRFPSSTTWKRSPWCVTMPKAKSIG